MGKHAYDLYKVLVYALSTKDELNRQTKEFSVLIEVKGAIGIGKLIEQHDPGPSYEMITPHDSFYFFTWSYRELSNSLLTLYVTSLNVKLNL